MTGSLDHKRQRVLISAYSCEPGGGSEDGVGWMWASLAALDHDVWVLTRENNGPAIEAAIAAAEAVGTGLSLHPVYVDLPPWARFWKKGLRGHRTYYLLWQAAARRRASLLTKTHDFDVVHHLTWASDSMPASVVGVGGVPSVWGPVGGSQAMPRSLYRWLSPKDKVSEVGRTVMLGVLRRVFGQRVSERAEVTVALNEVVRDRFAPHAQLLEVRPNVALDSTELARLTNGLIASGETGAERNYRAVFAGRLLAWKGLRLALEALARPEAANWSLDVFGKGPFADEAQTHVERLGLGDRVRFRDQIPRDELLAEVAAADAMLHPSMHDSSPWSVGEAIMVGTPVVCLDYAGPAAIIGNTGGVAVPISGDVPAALAQGLRQVQGQRVTTDEWSSDQVRPLLNRWYSMAIDRAAGRAVDPAGAPS